MSIDTNKIKIENKLYEKYSKYINNFFLKFKKHYDTHEIIQLSDDVFIKLIANLNNIDEADNGIQKWIKTTCKNIKIDFDRKRGIKKNISIENINVVYEDNVFDFDIIHKNDFLNKFIKYKKEGYKNTEICKILNISERKLYREINRNKKHVTI